jgi:acylphosphatase
VSAEQEPNLVRRHVVYHGRVQGVFFRATSYDLSRNFRVVGYVRNMPDGTVELEAEGPASDVDRFLEAIGQEYRHNLSRTEVGDVAPRGDEGEFRIRY